MDNQKQIKIIAAIILIVSAISVFGIFLAAGYLMFVPQFEQIRHIAATKASFYVWVVLWGLISLFMFVSSLALFNFRLWAKKAIIFVSILGLIAVAWGYFRIGRINILAIIYFAAIPILLSRKKIKHEFG